MLIQTNQALAEFCAKVRASEFLTVDTEFIRVNTYLPRLCVVQIAGGEHAAAIDVLAERLDLTPIWDLLLDTDMVKVFHAASQDLEIFAHLLGRVPSPLFDTQVAAAFTGFGDQVGYAQLVHDVVGVSVDKASQNTDWSRRPLTERQVQYALGDVTYLQEVYRTLRTKLEELGRTEWIAPTFRELEDAGRYRTNPRESFQRIKIRRPTREHLVVLRELAAWREDTARERNLPRSWVLRDDAMVEISQHFPRNERELSRVRNLKLKSRDMDEVLELVRMARALPEAEWPALTSRARVQRGDDGLVALLQSLLKIRASENQLAPRVIANRSDLDRLATGVNPDIPALTGWRREVFGEDALAMKEGKLGLTGNGEGGTRLLGD